MFEEYPVPPRPPRSHLYVPADQPRFLRSALRTAADALILDLEDAVAPQRKNDARAAAVDFARDRAAGGPELWVRVNAGPRGLADAHSLLTTGRVDGLWIPKATAGTDLDALAAAVAATAPTVALGLLVESATGLLTLATTARNPAVRRVQLGEVDLRADLRMPPDPGDHLLDWARGLAIAHSVAHGLDCAVAPVMVNIADRDAFRASSLHLRSLGFQGRACIHPDQVTIANEVFGVDDAELADAHALLDLFERHQRSGSGAFRDAHGAMVDAATVRRARDLTGRSSP